MTTSGIDVLWWGLLGVAIITAVLGWRREILFWQAIKRNRQAGMYDDPEFKRRIKPLNMWRYSLVGAILLEGVMAFGAFQMGVAPGIWWIILLIFLLPTVVWSRIIEVRWRKLMTKGLEDRPKD